MHDLANNFRSCPVQVLSAPCRGKPVLEPYDFFTCAREVEIVILHHLALAKWFIVVRNRGSQIEGFEFLKQLLIPFNEEVLAFERVTERNSSFSFEAALNLCNSPLHFAVAWIVSF